MDVTECAIVTMGAAHDRRAAQPAMNGSACWSECRVSARRSRKELPGVVAATGRLQPVHPYTQGRSRDQVVCTVAPSTHPARTEQKQGAMQQVFGFWWLGITCHRLKSDDRIDS